MFSEEVLDLIPDAVLIIDMNGKILFSNEILKKVFGYDPGELLGKNMDVLLRDNKNEDLAINFEDFTQKLSTRKMGVGTSLFGVTRSGEIRELDIAIGPFPTEKDTFAIVIIRDMTDAKETDRRLRKYFNQIHRLEEKIDFIEFVDGLDFNKPLRELGTLIDWLKEDFEEAEIESVKTFEILEDKLTKLGGLVKLLKEHPH